MTCRHEGSRNRPDRWVAWMVIGTVLIGAALTFGTAKFKAPLGLLDPNVTWCLWDVNGVLWCQDIDVNDPNYVYDLSHDSFADFEPNEHIDWTVDQSPLKIDANNYVAGGGGGVDSGTDPDVDEAGEVSADSNDHALRGYDTDHQYVYGKQYKTFNIPIPRPDGLSTVTGRSTKSIPVIYNDSGFSFIITKIRGVSDTDNFDFNLFESASNTDIGTANDTLIDLVECESNGTSCYYDEETTISHATIEDTHYVIFEVSAGTANFCFLSLTGYYDANVD